MSMYLLPISNLNNPAYQKAIITMSDLDSSETSVPHKASSLASYRNILFPYSHFGKPSIMSPNGTPCGGSNFYVTWHTCEDGCTILDTDCGYKVILPIEIHPEQDRIEGRVLLQCTSKGFTLERDGENRLSPIKEYLCF